MSSKCPVRTYVRTYSMDTGDYLKSGAEPANTFRTTCVRSASTPARSGDICTRPAPPLEELHPRLCAGSQKILSFFLLGTELFRRCLWRLRCRAIFASQGSFRQLYAVRVPAATARATDSFHSGTATPKLLFRRSSRDWKTRLKQRIRKQFLQLRAVE
jgi:hypothetical protein